ncbi:glypican 5, partial [Apostichopus japonicus]
NDLRICQTGLSCCTRDLEHQLWIKARHDYHSSIQSSVSYLKYTLSTAVTDFQGEYEDLLQYGEDGIHQHFGRSHPNIASNMHRSFELLFIDLQAYLQGHNINIDRSLGDFFDGLFPHVYSAYMNVGRLSNIYMQCLARERTVILPFGREDDAFSADLQNSLKVTRTLLQSLKLGLGVLNTTEHMPLSVKCKEVLTKMRYCPFCQGLTYARPCHGYCLNVVKGCLANFMDLDIYWTEYVTSVVDLIRSSMSADFDLQQVMHSLDDRIDRAIDYAVDNKDDITHAVLERCGPPPQMRQSNYNDYAINSPPMNVPIAPNPGIPLDERLLSFVETLDNSRGMYRNLPASVCQEQSMSSQSNSNCWNGRNVDRYTEEVVADGTVAQQWNPEVPLTGREPELVDALLLMDKLQKAARKTKMILESFEEDEDEELGDYMYSGSGSGEEMGSGCAFSDDEDCEEGSGGDLIGRGGKPGSPNITPTNTDLRYSPTPEPKLGDDPDKADSRQGDEVGTTKSSLSNKKATQSALLTAFATITVYLVVRGEQSDGCEKHTSFPVKLTCELKGERQVAKHIMFEQE